MKDWTPRRISFDPSLTLSRNEIFVLSRVDGTLSVSDLADLTGLDMGEVTKILGNLVQQGAVEAELGDDDDDDGGRISWIADQLPGSDGDPSTQNGDLATRSPPLESRILGGVLGRVEEHLAGQHARDVGVVNLRDAVLVAVAGGAAYFVPSELAGERLLGHLEACA